MTTTPFNFTIGLEPDASADLLPASRERERGKGDPVAVIAVALAYRQPFIGRDALVLCELITQIHSSRRQESCTSPLIGFIINDHSMTIKYLVTTVISFLSLFALGSQMFIRFIS